MQILYHIYPCVLLVLNLILCFLKCARNSGSVLHTHLRLCTCPLSLTPGCNVALVAAQMTVADAHVSAGSGIAHLPTAASALAQSGEGRHDVSSRVNTNCIFCCPLNRLNTIKWNETEVPWNTACGKTAPACRCSWQLLSRAAESIRNIISSRWHTYVCTHTGWEDQKAL